MRQPIRAASFRAILSGAMLAVVVCAPAAQAGRALPEELQGAQIVRAVHAGKLSAGHLSSSQLERVGEYVMGREVGSPVLHERMNRMMETMMGQAATDQMHISLGKRYLGQAGRSPASGAMMYGSGVSPATMMGNGMMGYRHTTHHGLPAGAIAAIVLGTLAVLGATTALLFSRRAR